MSDALRIASRFRRANTRVVGNYALAESLPQRLKLTLCSVKRLGVHILGQASRGSIQAGMAELHGQYLQNSHIRYFHIRSGHWWN